jgi:hypothetical protein
MSEADKISPGDLLKLELVIHGRQLMVTITNSTAQEQRLWEWNNSWGWWSVSFQVRNEAGKIIEMVRKSRDWTKNGPVYFVLQPQEELKVSIDLHDGWWEVAGANARNDRPVELRARLRIAPTTESDQLGVFTGDVTSHWIVSRPPHDWLPAD